MAEPNGYGPVEVTVEIDGLELVAGMLWVHERGEQSATFRYSNDYLRNPHVYELDPALALRSRVFQTSGGKGMFNAFGDSSPDRWGQNLMRRQERDRAKTASVTPRTLRGADFLLGVRDDIRQGAIRFREPGSRDYFSSHENAVPKVIECPACCRPLTGTKPAHRRTMTLKTSSTPAGLSAVPALKPP